MKKGYKKDLWFKFQASRVITGDISLQPIEIQGLFYQLCAHYMARGGNLSTAEAKERLSVYIKQCKIKNPLELIFSKFCKISRGRKLSIKFLDEQLESIENKSISARKAVSSRYVSKGSLPDVGSMWGRCGVDVEGGSDLRTYAPKDNNIKELTHQHAKNELKSEPMSSRCGVDVGSMYPPMSKDEKRDVNDMSNYKELEDNELESTYVLQTNDEKSTDEGIYKNKNKNKEKIYKKEKNSQRIKIEKALKLLDKNQKIDLGDIEEKFFSGMGIVGVMDAYIDHFYSLGYEYISDQGILNNFLAWKNKLFIEANFAKNEAKIPEKAKMTPELEKNIVRFYILMGQDSIISKFLDKHTSAEKKSFIGLLIEKYGMRKLIKLIIGYSSQDWMGAYGTYDHFVKCVPNIVISDSEFEKIVRVRKLNLDGLQ